MSPLANPRDPRRQELANPDVRFAAGGDPRERAAFRLDVGRSVRMHFLLAAVVAVAVFVLLVAFALLRKPVYQAEALIYIEPFEMRVLPDGTAGGYDASRYDSYLQQQTQTVKRPDTLEAALAKLPPGMWSSPGENPAVGVKRLQGALKIDRVLNSYELGIDVTAGDGTAAADAANAVAQAYLETGRRDEHARAGQRLQLLTEERQRITDDMTRDKAEQSQLGVALGVARPSADAGNPYDAQTAGLRAQLDAAREAHDAVSAQLSSVSESSGNGLATAANELILTDPGLVSIKQTLSQRRAVLSDQMAGLTPANPVYKQDVEEIAEIDRSMDRATADARQRAEHQLEDKLRLDMRRTADVEARLNAQLAQETARATGAGPKLQRASELETDLQRLSTRYATVDDAIRSLQLETGGPGQAHLALAASVPDAPQPSRRKLILLLALPIAVLCGIAAAVLARKRDKRLYIASDLEEVLGFEPMAVLPDAADISTTAYDDFLLRLAGALEGAFRHSGARSFVFTPVTVLGADSSLLPQLCRRLRQIGLRTDCIRAADLMSAPAEAENRGDDLKSPLERLLARHDLVLVQSPPLLGSALAEYVVRCADVAVLLVESGRSNRDDLSRATALLGRLNPQGIGAVLEKLPMRFADPVLWEAVRTADRTAVRPVTTEPAHEQTWEAGAARTPAPEPTPKPATEVVVEQEADAEHLQEFGVDPDPKVGSISPLSMEAEPPFAIVPATEAVPALAHQSMTSEAEVHGTMTEESVAEPEEERWAWQTPPVSIPPTALEETISADAAVLMRFREAFQHDEEKAISGSGSDTAPSFREPTPDRRPGARWKSWTQTDVASSPLQETGTTVAVVPPVPLIGAEVQQPTKISDADHVSVPSIADTMHSETEPQPGFFARVRSFFGFVDEPELQILPRDTEQVSEDTYAPAERPRPVERGTHARDVSSIPAFSVKEQPSGTEPFRDPAVDFAEEPASTAFVTERISPSPAVTVDGEFSEEPVTLEDEEPTLPASPGSALIDDGRLAIENQAPEPAFHDEVSPDRAESVTTPVIAEHAPAREIGESAGFPLADTSQTPSATPVKKRALLPLTVEAIPAVVTSIGVDRTKSSPAPAASEAAPHAGIVHQPPPIPPWPEHAGPLLPQASAWQRRGLARAASHATAEEGPPARASEGISALRSGAGLRKAVVRQEVALRSGQAASAPSVPTRDGAGGTGRRWAMLSRFGNEGRSRPAAPAPRDESRGPHV